ncbi:MAG: hypothetical protein P4L82_18275 [Ancalomicrobiaceae bacterium]|nr:hypothetical protein [Ancalomicrobiaceae bacterium]
MAGSPAAGAIVPPLHGDVIAGQDGGAVRPRPEWTRHPTRADSPAECAGRIKVLASRLAE